MPQHALEEDVERIALPLACDIAITEPETPPYEYIAEYALVDDTRIVGRRPVEREAGAGEERRCRVAIRHITGLQASSLRTRAYSP